MCVSMLTSDNDASKQKDTQNITCSSQTFDHSNLRSIDISLGFQVTFIFQMFMHRLRNISNSIILGLDDVTNAQRDSTFSVYFFEDVL